MIGRGDSVFKGEGQVIERGRCFDHSSAAFELCDRRCVDIHEPSLYDQTIVGPYPSFLSLRTCLSGTAFIVFWTVDIRVIQPQPSDRGRVTADLPIRVLLQVDHPLFSSKEAWR